MYSTLLTVALFVAPALASYAINQPELTQCEEAKISWPPTKGPYNVIVVSANEPCGEPLVDLGDTERTFINWPVNVPAGSVVQLSVADSGDEEAWTGNITVKGGSNKSCLPGGSPASSSAASSPSGVSTGNLTPDSSSNTDTANTDTDKDTTAPDIVGAANAGSNKFLTGAAPSTRQISQPVVALAALAAVAALAL